MSETAIVGGATGAAIMGMRPVAEMQFADFVSCAWDHLVTVAAKQRWRAGTPVPIVLRLPSGGGFSGGPFHSQNPESSFAHIPGLKCVCPATPEDAKGLLVAAIEDPNPVLFFEHKHLYRRIKGEVPDERYVTPIGKARIHAEGDDVSVITWGAMVYTAEEAAKQLPDTSIEIIDLRTIMPWDKQAVLESARKTSKVLVLHEDTRTGGFGGEIAATIAEEAFEDLDAPVKRIAAPDTPVPFSPVLEKAYIPQVDDVVAGLKELVSTDGKHRNRSRRRHAPDGRLGLGGHDHQVVEAGGRADRGRRDAARDLDRQGRHRGPEPGSGIVTEILVQEGETVEVGTVLARIGGEGSAAAPAPDAPAAEPAAASPQPQSLPPRPRRRLHPSPRRRPHLLPRRPPRPATEAQPPEPSTPAGDNGQSFVSPVVARIAAEHGIDPAQVPGTGNGGRVTKKDIQAFIEARWSSCRADPAGSGAQHPPRRAPAPQPPPAPRTCGAQLQPGARCSGTGESFEPMSAMRRGIAEHMRRSLDTSAHVTSAIEVDMSKVVAIREKLKKEYQAAYGVNPTYLAFIARATVETLARLPVGQRRAARRPDRHAQLRQPRLRGRARRRQGPDRPGREERRDAEPARHGARASPTSRSARATRS